MKTTPNNKSLLAAETPQYFPPLEYFHKIAQADIFVLADDLQFSKHAGLNRCRIKTAQGVRWLTVPVRSKNRFGQKIDVVEIVEENDWRHKHWRALAAHYCHAAYFEKYAGTLESFFMKRWKNLVELNCFLMAWLCSVLQINCRLVRSSEIKTNGQGSERIIAWAKALGCSFYLCDKGEKEFLQLEKFEGAGLTMKSYEFAPPVYHQQFGDFAANLSILDLILNEGEESGRILAGREQSA